ncbi:2-phosphoxylose phosphatase 1-like [Patiria miniata]|uniref:2-phosphoxylose phosphatase 1 n=1 Tax=Patiria miniata TaxID=46514 RepID=A0A914BHV4_PATMI|nr:2-phosphoxylose phosphatase 1-like [Patiria miniata]XP_038075479.1 2-phosphoxylose phosphatase 1-like [Patiria miniata]XP_038075480.1 2-phosphoxylose phosphatase 1-like [Patiria miniata]XP_038075481.1 2-phosphoxylose phosphatase 1-like [Patiria miniata]
MTTQASSCRSSMRYPFRKKHALALFAMLLFVCALWMLRQEEVLSKELSTSSVQEVQVNLMYPVGEGQYRKEQQRIVLEQQQQSFEQDVGPVETKRGNYRKVASKTREASVKELIVPPQDEQKPSKKKNSVNKKVEKLKKKRAKAKKFREEISEVPELSPVEMEEFQGRMKEYCNPPWEPVNGEEGQVNEDYELHHVHVIARHGDRTPMTQFNIPDITVDTDFNCNLETAREKLPSSTLLSRFLASIMAQEEALGGWPLMPWFLRKLPIGGAARRCGMAQLTPTGWLQHMKLGERLRQAYTSKLVPHRAYFRNPNMTRFKSTINSRTQQSAFAFMFGFLPRLELRHGEWLKAADNFLFCPSNWNCSCPAYSRLEKSKQQLYSAVQKNTTEVQQLLRSVAVLLMKEPKTKSLPGITGQQEMYSALICHKKPLPCSPYGCVAQKHLAKIVAYTDRVGRELRSNEHGPHQKLARLSMHPLLTEIALRMKKISHGASNYPKFAFYSGHDVTMTPLLDALGLGEYHWPPYASNVIFEMWSKAGEFFFRVLYNGQDKTSLVRFCRKNLNADGLCPLRFFLKFVNKDNMGFFHADSFEKACQLTF